VHFFQIVLCTVLKLQTCNSDDKGTPVTFRLMRLAIINCRHVFIIVKCALLQKLKVMSNAQAQLFSIFMNLKINPNEPFR